MKIDAIKNGIVIDHITAGCAMQLYNMLGLDKLDCSVAIIKNVPSAKMGKKDIIKIDSNINVNLDIVSFISPDATVNIIVDGICREKRNIELPERLVNIIKCKNPRCITTTEQEIRHIFVLADRNKREYRCIYCDTKADSRKNYKLK
ncbi:MAG: aspartate carbamoyltransferase regulatory subunit [Parasporobacterium sp.]|nr:aspartate carbamoyltransferase regulatory subunit [Parasporobacterium sp.]